MHVIFIIPDMLDSFRYLYKSDYLIIAHMSVNPSERNMVMSRGIFVMLFSILWFIKIK